MSVHVNVRMFKIMCMPIKVGVHVYEMYANCRTLPCEMIPELLPGSKMSSP